MMVMSQLQLSLLIYLLFPLLLNFLVNLKQIAILPTRILIGVSNFFVNYWGGDVGAYFCWALFLVCLQYIRSSKGRRQLGYLKN